MHAVTVVDPTGARTAMSKALEFLRKELIEMLPPTLFFFAVFEIGGACRGPSAGLIRCWRSLIQTGYWSIRNTRGRRSFAE
jgi:hypothetical protein